MFGVRYEKNVKPSVSFNKSVYNKRVEIFNRHERAAITDRTKRKRTPRITALTNRSKFPFAPSGSIAAEGSPRIGRISTERRSRSCASPQSASCLENSAIRPEVSGRTLREMAQDHGMCITVVRPPLVYGELQRCCQLCVLRERSMGEIEPSSDDAQRTPPLYGTFEVKC